MILSEQVYMVVRQQLMANNITAYSDHVPDETAYPFCMYEILNLDLYPDWGFNKDYEKLTVRFNVYGDKYNPMDTITICETIEDIFNRKQVQFLESEGGIRLICSYKVNDSVTYMEEEDYWLSKTDYVFECERNVGGDADSSSSSSD